MNIRIGVLRYKKKCHVLAKKMSSPLASHVKTHRERAPHDDFDKAVDMVRGRLGVQHVLVEH